MAGRSKLTIQFSVYAIAFIRIPIAILVSRTKLISFIESVITVSDRPPVHLAVLCSR